MIQRGLKMNISEFRITFINEGEDSTCCWFSDDENNIYYDNHYTGAYYSEGDLVRVGWAYFGGETRKVLWVERIAGRRVV